MDWSKIEKDLHMHTEYLSAARRDRGDRSISNSLSSSSQAPSLGVSNRSSLYGTANSSTGMRRNLYAIDDPKSANNMSISSQGITYNCHFGSGDNYSYYYLK